MRIFGFIFATMVAYSSQVSAATVQLPVSDAQGYVYVRVNWDETANSYDASQVSQSSQHAFLYEGGTVANASTAITSGGGALASVVTGNFEAFAVAQHQIRLPQYF